MTSFTDSQYRFTNPIRVFKANDPIYYEVQNIPLKELQENDLWLKDQIENLVDRSGTGVDRSDINELKPYVDGSDNVVKVKPGRFTARINDAYNITPLQILNNVMGENVLDYNAWLAAGANATRLADTINRFKQDIMLGLNGLAERAFTYPAKTPDRANTGVLTDFEPVISYLRGIDERYGQPPYPGIGAVMWNRFNAGNSASLPGGLPNPDNISAPNEYVIRQYDPNDPNIGFARLGAAETAFIKRWRGVARTAVVDIPEELTIEIPAFNDNDHFYIDANSNKVYTPATQRIDLLFAYSKPIDASATTVAKFVNRAPTTITRAELGIVYGAGIGVHFRDFEGGRIQEVLSPNGADKGFFQQTDDSTLPDGTVKMLSHYGDESGANTGFTLSNAVVKGSFPSPDDLMNLTPLLDEELTSSSLALVGQTVLPLAYIVVKKNASLNSNGTNVITTNDLIDIRPLFRTTELSYNERAGLAAAIPAPSLANPVVTQGELDYELNRVYADLISRIPVINPPTGGGGGTTEPPTQAAPVPRTVAAGTLYGGYNYGVEGALGAYVLKVSPGLSNEQVKQILRVNYGYGDRANIPDLPSWEIAKWVDIRASFSNKGSYPNDRVNISTLIPSEFGAYTDLAKARRARMPGITGDDTITPMPYTGNNTGLPAPLTDSDTYPNTVFVKKTILIDRTAVPWMSDYMVNVQLMNCIPITQGTYPGPAGVWVDKRADRFTIFVAWGARDKFPVSVENNITQFREGNEFVGFVVMNKELAEYQTALARDALRLQNNNTVLNGQSSCGYCIYPTVKFEVVGIPESFYNPTEDFTSSQPTITLA